MDRTVVARMRWVGTVVLLCSLGACSDGGGADSSGPTPSTSGSPQGSSAGASPGVTAQDHASRRALTRVQRAARSAAGQVESGEGLRVENRTGAPVVLVFPDGDTAEVAVGRSVVVLRACDERLPLRAESRTGLLIAERSGPCRATDTWVVGRPAE